MYRQFVPSEGNKLKTLAIASLVGTGHGRDISKHVHSLNKMKNCRQIKSHYRYLALHHHPDKEGGSEEDFVRLTEAKDRALQSCSNDSARTKTSRHDHRRGGKNRKHKTTGSAKKRAKMKRKKARDKARKKAREKSDNKGSLSEPEKAILAGALMVGGIEMVRRTPGRVRLRRMNSDENYEHVTGHPRRHQQGGHK